MEYSKETINEFVDITNTAKMYASAIALRDGEENYELNFATNYIVELEDKLKFFIQQKSKWQERAIKLQ